MSKSFGLTVLVGFLCISPATAGQGEDAVLVGLPHKAVRALNEAFPGAEFLHVRKELEGDKECYVVTVMHTGRQSEYYVSRDGHVFARKVFSVMTLPKQLAGYLVLSLLPGAISGAAARALVQATKRRQLSVMLEWLAAWVGAAIGIGIVLTQMATVPREKDTVALGLIIAICGGISASVVESVGLVIQSLRGLRPSHLRSLFVCFTLACAFLCLSIPVDMFRTERENEHYRTQAMKSPHG